MRPSASPSSASWRGSFRRQASSTAAAARRTPQQICLNFWHLPIAHRGRTPIAQHHRKRTLHEGHCRNRPVNRKMAAKPRDRRSRLAVGFVAVRMREPIPGWLRLPLTGAVCRDFRSWKMSLTRRSHGIARPRSPKGRPSGCFSSLSVWPPTSLGSGFSCGSCCACSEWLLQRFSESGPCQRQDPCSVRGGKGKASAPKSGLATESGTTMDAAK